MMNNIKIKTVAFVISMASAGAFAQAPSDMTLQNLQHSQQQTQDGLNNLGAMVLDSTSQIQSQISANKQFAEQSRQNLQTLETDVRNANAALQYQIESNEQLAVESRHNLELFENDVIRNAAQTQSQLDSQGARMDAYGKLISSNAGRTTQALNGVSTLSHAVDQQNQQIGSNKQLGMQNQQAISANEQIDSAQANAIVSNQQHLNQLQTSITSRANTNTQHISENRAAIVQDHEQLAKQDQIVHANTQAIQQEQHDIAANREAINQNSADIKDLRKDMENLAKNVDGAFAESAAFSGLVDPYGVGNIAVTAALGYHGDAEAIAIGMGERFNENLTAKVGGAYDTATESMSAYVGVGYEF